MILPLLRRPNGPCHAPGPEGGIECDQLGQGLGTGTCLI